jgi:hypothetical protein
MSGFTVDAPITEIAEWIVGILVIEVIATFSPRSESDFSFQSNASFFGGFYANF